MTETRTYVLKSVDIDEDGSIYNDITFTLICKSEEDAVKAAKSIFGSDIEFDVEVVK